MNQPLTDQQLDEIEACVTGPLGSATVFDHTTVAPLVAEVRRLRAELATARVAALLEGATAIDHLRAIMLAPPVADRYSSGLSGAAGELRRLAAAAFPAVPTTTKDGDTAAASGGEQ